MIRTFLLGTVAALTLSACANMGAETARSSAELTTASATVVSVDAATRDVVIQDDVTGERFSVVAGPEVRNFAQIAAGDTVTIEFFEATTLAMADPADPGTAITGVAAGRAPEGEMPGGMALASTSMVVEVISYDSASASALIRTPDGRTIRTTVPAEMRSFAEQRRRGDRVAVTITDAIAVTMTEPAA
jgi:hypothetical protein